MKRDYMSLILLLEDFVKDTTYHSCMKFSVIDGMNTITIRVPRYRYTPDYDDIRFDLEKLNNCVRFVPWEPDDNYWLIETKVKTKKSITSSTFNNEDDVYELCGQGIQPFFKKDDEYYSLAFSKKIYDEYDFLEYRKRKGI
jgi:hypothetical protein